MAENKDIITIDNNFPSNSNGDNANVVEPNNAPILKKVNPNNRVEKKKTFFSNFLDIASDIMKYTLDEVLVPTFKRTASEIVRTASDRAIWGESVPTRRRASSYWDDYDYPITKYDSYYSRGRDYSYSRREEYPTYTKRNRNELPPLVFSIESAARDFLDNIVDVMEYRHEISVNEVYDAYGNEQYLREIDYTWTNYGWEDTPGRDLRGADVKSIRGGWIITLPKPVPLEK